jgi:hypothetical protein
LNGGAILQDRHAGVPAGMISVPTNAGENAGMAS